MKTNSSWSQYSRWSRASSRAATARSMPRLTGGSAGGAGAGASGVAMTLQPSTRCIVPPNAGTGAADAALSVLLARDASARRPFRYRLLRAGDVVPAQPDHHDLVQGSGAHPE